MSVNSKSLIEELLDAKQEMIRDYQMRADETDRPEVHRMLKHFAEEEARQAAEMRSLLHTLG